MRLTRLVTNTICLTCIAKFVDTQGPKGVFEHEVVVGGVRNNLIGEDFISTYRCTWDHDESSFVVGVDGYP